MTVDATDKPSVLILCNQFPPVNGTGARRPYYLARQLADEGHRVSVLSNKIEEAQPWLPNLQGIRTEVTPITHVQRDTNALQRGLAKAHWKFQGKPGHGILRLAADLFLPEGHIDRWDMLPAVVEQLVGRHDVVLATCPAFYHFRLAARLAKRWKAMYLADYRDPWTIRIPTLSLGGITSFGTGLSGSLRNARMRLAERHWPGQAFALTAISQPLLDNSILTTGLRRSMVVTGGYDPLLQPIPFTPNKRFTLVYTGRVYRQQDWHSVLHTIERLHTADPLLKDKLQVHLYGAVSTDPALLVRMNEVAKRTGVIALLPRLSREDTMRAQQTADALLHLSLDHHQGSLPVKFLEYLGAGRPIVLFIKEPDLESEVLYSTHTGCIVRNAQALEQLLTERIAAWQAGIQWRIDPDRTQLDTFNYAYQMRLWTAKLREWYTEFLQAGKP